MELEGLLVNSEFLYNFFNKVVCFHGEELLVPRPNPKLEDQANITHTIKEDEVRLDHFSKKKSSSYKN